MKNIINKVLRLLILAFLAFGFIMLIKSSYQEIFAEIKKTSFLVLAICSILLFAYYIIRNFLYTDTIRQFSRTLSLHSSIFCSFLCSFYNLITFGTGSIVYTLYYYKKHEILETETVGIQFYQYLIFKVVQLILGNTIAFLHIDLLMNEPYVLFLFLIADILSILVVIACIMLCTSEKIHRFVINIGYKVIKKETWRNKINEYDNNLTQLRYQFPHLFHKKFMIRQFVCTLIMYIIYYSLPYVILYSTGISYVTCFTLISIMSIIAGVLVFPGGIGSVEISYLLLFNPIVGNVYAVSSLLVYRFMTFLLPILIGGSLALAERLWKLCRSNK